MTLGEAAPATVPVPTETVALRMSDGAEIQLRRHGNPAGPRLVLSHGNGLAIDGYYSFWRLLAPRYDLVLFDLRNHGRNPTHVELRHDWDMLASDIAATAAGIRAAFGDKPMTALVHSASAIATLRVMLAGQAPWDAAVLFDPPIYPPPGHALAAQAAQEWRALSMRTRRRPERYQDPSGLAQQFARSSFMRRWRPEAYNLMASATLRPDPERGDWELACPRAFEAALFETNIDPRYFELIGTLPGPLAVVGADPDRVEAEIPPLVNRALAALGRIDYRPIPDTTHFLQVENPEACVAAVEDFLRSRVG